MTDDNNDGRTDGRTTDRTNCLTPLAHTRRGVMIATGRGVHGGRDI